MFYFRLSTHKVVHFFNLWMELEPISPCEKIRVSEFTSWAVFVSLMLVPGPTFLRVKWVTSPLATTVHSFIIVCDLSIVANV